MHAGIDFGSKLAGTTAICYQKDNQLVIFQSLVKRDADRFILDMLSEIQCQHVFIDAPLSLPGAYFGKGNDFMYRKADRLVNAMSPMFLGGLTARAMRLQQVLEQQEVSCFEAYPKQIMLNYFNNLSGIYKAKNKENEFIQELDLPIQTKQTPTNWHQVDAVLAWYAGYRFLNKEGQTYGDPGEGLIYA